MILQRQIILANFAQKILYHERLRNVKVEIGNVFQTEGYYTRSEPDLIVLGFSDTSEKHIDETVRFFATTVDARLIGVPMELIATLHELGHVLSWDKHVDDTGDRRDLDAYYQMGLLYGVDYLRFYYSIHNEKLANDMIPYLVNTYYEAIFYTADLLNGLEAGDELVYC